MDWDNNSRDNYFQTLLRSSGYPPVTSDDNLGVGGHENQPQQFRSWSQTGINDQTFANENQHRFSCNEMGVNDQSFGNEYQPHRFSCSQTGLNDQTSGGNEFVPNRFSCSYPYYGQEYGSSSNNVDERAGYGEAFFMNNNPVPLNAYNTGNENGGGSNNIVAEDEDEDDYSIAADSWGDEFQLEDFHTLALVNAITERRSIGRPHKTPFHTGRKGKAYVQSLLNAHPKRFYRELKMQKDTFVKIVYELENWYGWECGKSTGIQCSESFAMFMWLLKGNSNPEIQETFQHSGETVHRHIHKMLKCLEKFVHDKIKQVRAQDDPHPYLDKQKMYEPFKGHCIGALDITHVMVRCRKKEEEKLFIGRKGYATQNILAVCDFDLTFVFVSAGWEGTFHDYNIFKRVVFSRTSKFPKPEKGKYYLVDAGFPNKDGFLAPFKGCRYHLPDFRLGKRPIKTDRETFNRAHSSLRSCIERTFGVWKKRFKFLQCMSWYSIETQVQLVLASMAIHNYIRRDKPEEELSDKVYAEKEYVFEDLPDADPNLEDEEDRIWDDEADRSMTNVRNNIMAALTRKRRSFFGLW